MQMTTQNKLVTSVAAAALLFGLAACDNGDAEGADDAASGQAADEQAAEEQPQEGGEAGAPGEQEMPEPDLGDVPDVVAEVNDEDISGAEYTQAYETQFSQMAMQAQMTGEEVDEEALQEEILDNLIGYELLVQEAEAEGYEATEEEVDAELEEVAEQNGAESVDELLEIAEEQGTDEEQLREDVEQQVLINQVVDSLDVEEPTDEEVEETYEEFAAQQEQAPAPEGEDGEEAETPDLEELRPEIEEQLVAEKENEAVVAHMEDLREDADVETHV